MPTKKQESLEQFLNRVQRGIAEHNAGVANKYCFNFEEETPFQNCKQAKRQVEWKAVEPSRVK